MEHIMMTKNSKKYGFKRGDEFDVLRNIMMDCVIIRDSNTPNIIMSERMARYYGLLCGDWQLGG